MRNRHRFSLLALPLLAISMFTVGCDEKKAEPPAAPSSTTTAANTTTAATPATASAAAPAMAVAVAPSGHLAHCPNAVTGAATLIKEIEGGVELDITGKDDATTKDIRARAMKLADVAKSGAAQSKHTGAGGGGGIYGRCPVVMRMTTVAVSDMEGGSKITVKPKTAAEIDWLRRETKQRQANLDPNVKSGAGERKMAHCPSAVDGASTQVKDNKDGVVLTVTAKADDAAKAIRERAKHVVDVSKHPSPKPEHNGEGKGGGGLGRCPELVADATVDAKDVPGGSEVTLHAKKPADVALLQSKAKDRAANFAHAVAIAPK